MEYRCGLNTSKSGDDCKRVNQLNKGGLNRSISKDDSKKNGKYTVIMGIHTVK
jgi:hypothetical protein